MNNLYCIEDGDRVQGDSDDRDLYVAAQSTDQALIIWREYYGTVNNEVPYRIWRCTAAQIQGDARPLLWNQEFEEMEV